MRRRRLLAAIAAGASVAGCVGRGTDAPAASPSDSPTPTPGETTIVDASLSRLGDCDADRAGDVDRTIEDGVVTIEGCITGRNGCMRATLGEVTVTDGTLSVTIETTEDGQMCTQQIVHRNYRATVEYEGRDPVTVAVTHDNRGLTETATE